MKLSALIPFGILLLSACGLDIDGPAVVSVDPPFGAMLPDRTPTIRVTFDEPVSLSSARNAFSLSEDGSGKINGTITVTNRTLYFVPDQELNGGAVFRITITTALTDRKGNLLEEEYHSRFQTGTNLAPPRPDFVSPTNLQSGVALTNALIIVFDRGMDAVSVRDNLSLTPQADGRHIWNASTNMLTFIPFSPLTPATHYTLTLKKDMLDATGIKLGTDRKIIFTTGTNFNQPLVEGVFQTGDLLPYPDRFWTNHYASVKKDEPLVVSFNMPMDRITAESAFSLSPDVTGYFSWQEDYTGPAIRYQLLFHPAAPLAPGQRYTLALSSGAKGQNGLPVISELNRTFTVSTNYFVRITEMYDGSGTVLTNGMITTLTVTSNSTTLYFRFATFDNAAMNPAAVQEAISIARLFGSTPTYLSGTIYGFNWTGGHTLLQLDLGDLSVSNVYLLKIKGKSGGAADTNNNPLANTMEVMLRVQ